MSEALSQPLSIDISFPVEGVALVELVGELEVVSVEEFSVRMADLGGGGPIGVVIDLAGISFIDSSGINALVQAMQSGRGARRNGCRRRRRAPSPSASSRSRGWRRSSRWNRIGRSRLRLRRRGTRLGTPPTDGAARRTGPRGRQRGPRSGARRRLVAVPPAPRRRRGRRRDAGRRHLDAARLAAVRRREAEGAGRAAGEGRPRLDGLRHVLRRPARAAQLGGGGAVGRQHRPGGDAGLLHAARGR